MRDLPPVSPGQYAPVNYEAEGTGARSNGGVPSHPGSPLLPRPIPCHVAGSPTIPHRPTKFQPLPLRRPLVSQVSLDSPLSPASRPHSPWGRFDPYDSPEVRFCVLFFTCVCVCIPLCLLTVLGFIENVTATKCIKTYKKKEKASADKIRCQQTDALLRNILSFYIKDITTTNSTSVSHG
uniref:Uncharacterized protein n=1 Tax=Echeneis naucrates TaxID=173247 RepID=A0A665TLI0_ECHNA